MHGQITKFSKTLGYGVIAAEDGRKYRFAGDQVMNVNGKLVGHDVDFLLSTARAKDVILLTGSAWSVFADNHGSR
ncbi:MAG: hypothetical protein AAFV69_05390 [Pseudomonadota bacterium]